MPEIVTTYRGAIDGLGPVAREYQRRQIVRAAGLAHTPSGQSPAEVGRGGPCCVILFNCLSVVKI